MSKTNEEFMKQNIPQLNHSMGAACFWNNAKERTINMRRKLTSHALHLSLPFQNPKNPKRSYSKQCQSHHPYPAQTFLVIRAEKQNDSLT